MSAAPLDFDDTDDDPLEAIGTEVVAPAIEPGDEVRERFAASGADEALGRLAALAVWWAEVRGDARAGAPARVVALGAGDDAPLPPTVTRRALDPAPDGVPTAVDAAVARGTALADELADAGTDLVLLPLELGIAGRALTGYLMGLDPVETNGWQTTDLDDERWMDEVALVRDTQWALRGLRGRPIAMVRVLADPRLAAATAFLLRSAVRRTPVVLDGPGAVTTALLAARCSRLASRWWLPAEVGDAPLHERSLGSLNLTAVTRLGLRVEDGTASAGALGLLGIAATLLARD
ncbi:nicotinate-nucleotide--dimethylbenzimidazole phosphoribosyltransferase [Kineosporia sp. A_224]|uniref:nicotinate-nucleotide--dimethylbenzimidazole phosphoribosyltransferase n=1 Tax=Kineosporia sp. A_224 TaxID=1962180 RepID=UPI000B4BEBCD|nr:nicotinate-nucleotide--dimethylbenzimidazole phosphoribosyltransferase [Kineosporia sp. A_224]